MKLTILGSGTTDPTTKRNEPGYLLEVGGNLILLDTGSGTKEHVIDAGYDYLKISHILISHTHVDHVADLPALFWSWMVKKRSKDVLIFGPRGIKKFIDKIIEAFFPNFLKFAGFKLKIKEMHNSIYKAKNWQLNSIFTWRQGSTLIPYALAYRIEDRRKSFVYGADMCFDYPKSIVKISKNADLLLIESAYPNQKKQWDHLTPSRAGKLATEAGVKKLVLTHFYPPCEKYDIKKQAWKTYRGPIILAKDLMKIKI
jgi:ribonuclease BN (tRNA processing enzyme)